VSKKKSLIVKTLAFGAVSFTNYYLLFRDPSAWPNFITQVPHMDPMMRVATSIGIVLLAIYWSIVHGTFTHCLLDLVKISSLKREVSQAIMSEGFEGLNKWIAKTKAMGGGSR
jgi:hypothetical protein